MNWHISIKTKHIIVAQLMMENIRYKENTIHNVKQQSLFLFNIIIYLQEGCTTIAMFSRAIVEKSLF